MNNKYYYKMRNTKCIIKFANNVNKQIDDFFENGDDEIIITHKYISENTRDFIITKKNGDLKIKLLYGYENLLYVKNIDVEKIVEHQKKRFDILEQKMILNENLIAIIDGKIDININNGEINKDNITFGHYLLKNIKVWNFYEEEFRIVEKNLNSIIKKIIRQFGYERIKFKKITKITKCNFKNINKDEIYIFGCDEKNFNKKNGELITGYGFKNCELIKNENMFDIICEPF